MQSQIGKVRDFHNSFNLLIKYKEVLKRAAKHLNKFIGGVDANMTARFENKAEKDFDMF